MIAEAGKRPCQPQPPKATIHRQYHDYNENQPKSRRRLGIRRPQDREWHVIMGTTTITYLFLDIDTRTPHCVGISMAFIDFICCLITCVAFACIWAPALTKHVLKLAACKLLQAATTIAHIINPVSKLRKFKNRPAVRFVFAARRIRRRRHRQRRARKPRPRRRPAARGSCSRGRAAHVRTVPGGRHACDGGSGPGARQHSTAQ